jgi:tRNA (guanine6-N2)-methyltransferase
VADFEPFPLPELSVIMLAMKKQIRPVQPVKSHSRAPQTTLYEAEVAEGLESITRDEIKHFLGKKADVRNITESGAVRFHYAGDPGTLLNLQTAISISAVSYFPVPRPRALLGHEHLTTLLRQIDTIRAMFPRDSFKTLYLSAAGAESSVMTRLKEELATKTRLVVSPDKGDLWMRLRRSGEGWETLIRLSPRPLATRAYRVCNLEGALNAAVAHAMVLMSSPRREDVVLNIGCGSGTLMIERLRSAQAKNVIGCDIDTMALDCARTNLEAAGLSARAQLCLADTRKLPLLDNSIDTIFADLPFGQLVGTHTDNIVLYPVMLHETARVAKPGASFVVITHEIRLIESLLSDSKLWRVEDTKRIMLGGLHPRIYLLRKK